MYYKSWRCHHNDNLTKILTKMAFIILIFESDIRSKYRLWRQWPFNDVFILTFQVSEVAQELSLSILAPPCCSFFFFTEHSTVWFVCNLSFLLLLIHRLLGRFMVSFLTNFTFSSSTSPASDPSGNQHTLDLFSFSFIFACLCIWNSWPTYCGSGDRSLGEWSTR